MAALGSLPIPYASIRVAKEAAAPSARRGIGSFLAAKEIVVVHTLYLDKSSSMRSV